MPTVSEVVGGLLDNAIKNPRSSISSILTAALSGIPVALGTGMIHGKAAVALGTVLGASKIIWGVFFQKDAQRTLALVPGDPTPQMVPAHGIPDDPAAMAVVESKSATSGAPQ